MAVNRRMILLIRTLHGLITVTFLSCIFYIYYSVFTGSRSYLLYLAVGLILIEGLVVSLNKGDCPLGPIHHKYGDDKAFFELLLPKRQAKQAVPFLGLVTLIGILLLFI
jgi:hypothetical protein